MRELDALPFNMLGVGDDKIFAQTYDGVNSIAMDGSAEQIITPISESVVFSGAALYQQERAGMNAGDLVAYDLEGGSRRVLGTWAGFPTQLAVLGSQVVWRGEEHLGIGDGIIRTVVDDGVTTSPEPSVVCPSDATGLLVVGSSVVFWSWPGPELFSCPLAGGPVTQMWTDGSLYNIEYAVRGDPTLVAIIDHDDVVTLYRIMWPGLSGAARRPVRDDRRAGSPSRQPPMRFLLDTSVISDFVRDARAGEESSAPSALSRPTKPRGAAPRCATRFGNASTARKIADAAASRRQRMARTPQWAPQHCPIAVPGESP